MLKFGTISQNEEENNDQEEEKLLTRKWINTEKKLQQLANETQKLTSNCSKVAYDPFASLLLTVAKSIGCSMTS